MAVLFEYDIELIPVMHLSFENYPRFFATFALSDGLDINKINIIWIECTYVANMVVKLGIYQESSEIPFTLELVYSTIPTWFFEVFRDGYVSSEGACLSGNDLWFPFMLEDKKIKTFNGINGTNNIEISIEICMDIDTIKGEDFNLYMDF